MADSINNWVHDKAVSESTLRVAERVRKLEQQRKKKGWRFITLDNRTKVFVPCDKDGKPTKHGEHLIAEIKAKCNV